jgi:hypothetical protein
MYTYLPVWKELTRSGARTCIVTVLTLPTPVQTGNYFTHTNTHRVEIPAYISRVSRIITSYFHTEKEGR